MQSFLVVFLSGSFFKRKFGVKNDKLEDNKYDYAKTLKVEKENLSKLKEQFNLILKNLEC
ncbi:MAG: hypothetical protein ACTSRZ_21215 [Promethearchaeota archaeon]